MLFFSKFHQNLYFVEDKSSNFLKKSYLCAVILRKKDY